MHSLLTLSTKRALMVMFTLSSRVADGPSDITVRYKAPRFTAKEQRMKSEKLSPIHHVWAWYTPWVLKFHQPGQVPWLELIS